MELGIVNRQKPQRPYLQIKMELGEVQHLFPGYRGGVQRYVRFFGSAEDGIILQPSEREIGFSEGSLLMERAGARGGYVVGMLINVQRVDVVGVIQNPLRVQPVRAGNNVLVIKPLPKDWVKHWPRATKNSAGLRGKLPPEQRAMLAKLLAPPPPPKPPEPVAPPAPVLRHTPPSYVPPSNPTSSSPMGFTEIVSQDTAFGELLEMVARVNHLARRSGEVRFEVSVKENVPRLDVLRLYRPGQVQLRENAPAKKEAKNA